MKARPVQPEDEALILEWANDPVTRQNSFSPDPITADAHHEWFHRRVRSVNCRFYVIERDGVDIGQARFEHQYDGRWEVHYALAPAFRGLGLGRSMLESALLVFQADVPGAVVYGQVKPENWASRRVFERLGFSGVVEYQR